DIVILREKDLEEEHYKLLAKKVKNACEEREICFIPHTFVNTAKTLGCEALHLTYGGFLQQPEVTARFPVVGVSIHSLAEAKMVEERGGAYVVASNIWETDCKPGLSGRGLPWLEEVCKGISLPVYALGGVKPELYGDLEAAGAAGACMMSWYMKR
ncbi:MAG: thiamine phosphate synthase, partial [Anaerovoracaceae bacterium]